MPDFTKLPCRDGNGNVHLVVEAPRGSLVKLKFEPELGVFSFRRPLELGLVYPYDWGFIPSTRAADGDPLDGMVLFDAPTWPGVVVPSRPIGAVRMTQKGGISNDRIILVPAADARYEEAASLPERVRTQLEHFFLNASEAIKKAHIEGWTGAKVARELVDAAATAYAKRGGVH
jgi:inorganic pyrophosphatase